ncbi:helix-turn-helix domain-containing protein [Mesorhizobium sp. ES1-3]|uniref:AraC family transcriptional regulator n=1 Tax=Mesorhizobium sp. ES1-3 TaxID=2876628 RepID=UPI001CCB351B|nr:AraC family transcriptional regulator [Mesorhizobium sp. ES1-3]MBZ9670285.1 AraC family transcriptional regulator [Mesorhizobium sp. ES1-3]
MTEAIRLYWGRFGHVSVLNVASDFVTHAHVEAHLIIWLEGTAGEMTIGRETVRLGQGTAAGINSLQPHSHVLSQDGRPGLFLAFYIDPDWARRRRDLPSSAPLFSQAAIALEPWLHQAAASLLDHLTDNESVDDIANYEIERFIDSVLDAADASAPREARGRINTMQDFRVRKAIQLMKANVCERISFDDVARAVGLSRPHFFALFKEQTSLTPNVYWNTLRMEEAVRQLQWSREPLISVACNLGFTTQGNFSRFFRDHVGVPPTLYREAARATA